MTFKRIPLHFRKYYISGHDALIGGEYKGKFAFMRLTHSRKSGHKNNLKLVKNPDLRFPLEDSYLTKVIEIDNKTKFGNKSKSKILSKMDKENLEKWFNNNKLFIKRN